MTDNSQTHCKFCRQVLKNYTELHRELQIESECEVCGTFCMTNDFHYKHYPILASSKLRENELHLLSGYTREQNDFGKERAIITDKNFRSIIDAAPCRIPDKTAKLLSALELMSDHFGQKLALTPSTDYSLAYARNVDEFTSILEYAKERHFIDWTATSEGRETTLRVEGIEELESRQRSNLDSEKCFVAMWFSDEMQSIYENQIAKAVEAAGYRPIRIDQEEFTGDLVDRMLAEIRESRFVIADFTAHREGVYFEAGFALGLSLDVIWMCRNDHMENSHFDINHFNHIVWNPDKADLAELLKNRILRVVGRGPLNSQPLEE